MADTLVLGTSTYGVRVRVPPEAFERVYLFKIHIKAGLAEWFIAVVLKTTDR